MEQSARLNEVIGSHAGTEFTDSTSLVDAGLVSLSIFRILAELKPDPSVEIDVEGLASVCTISELKVWLGKMIAGPVAGLR